MFGLQVKRCSISVAILLFANGCANFGKSRYAMDDPVYAAKYEDGAEKTDVAGKVKQAIDARYVEGLEGGYYGGGSQWRGDDVLGGGEIGYETYPVSWVSSRVGLGAFIGHGDWYAGVDSGVRLQLPTRLAPFVGVGTFNGLSTTYVSADDDGIDNDDDDRIDERGEEKLDFDGWLSSVYPEVGAHFWATGQTRITAFGRYLVTTEGREHDDWLIGFQVSAFHR
ncbi:MAG: hypothetical protein AAGG44_10630 [Planctomycetota bacterium]